MSRIDDVITAIPAMTETKRATWAVNVARVIAKGPRRNPAHADALRLRDALTAFEATRPAEAALITAFWLDWFRAVKDRTTFRGFDGDRLVAHITRVRPGKFVVQVRGAALPRPYTTLCAARAAAARATIVALNTQIVELRDQIGGLQWDSCNGRYCIRVADDQIRRSSFDGHVKSWGWGSEQFVIPEGF